MSNIAGTVRRACRPVGTGRRHDAGSATFQVEKFTKPILEPNPRTQSELVDVAGVIEVTIRVRYKEFVGEVAILQH